MSKVASSGPPPSVLRPPSSVFRPPSSAVRHFAPSAPLRGQHLYSVGALALKLLGPLRATAPTAQPSHSRNDAVGRGPASSRAQLLVERVAPNARVRSKHAEVSHQRTQRAQSIQCSGFVILVSFRGQPARALIAEGRLGSSLAAALSDIAGRYSFQVSAFRFLPPVPPVRGPARTRLGQKTLFPRLSLTTKLPCSSFRSTCPTGACTISR